MRTKRTIDSFFKRTKDVRDHQLHPVSDNIEEDVHNTQPQPDRNNNIEKPNNIEHEKNNMSNSLIRDPGERPSILSYPRNQRKTPASTHNFSVRCYEDLKNQLCHIENVIEKQMTQQVMDNRLRLKVSIETIKWLTFQGCALIGHDERPNSRNQGNFLELIKFLASYNKTVVDVMLENAPQNAKYTSPDIQKEILHVLATNVQKAIRDEIGMSKFCLIVDESQDESKKEQMAIVVRFFDQDGHVKERFLDLICVNDTTSLTLKNEILCSLSYHKLSVQDIRGQGYDGASNMRGEWNGLQALLLKECPYAYYIHCFAHQLQLTLIAASKDVTEVGEIESGKVLNDIAIKGSTSSQRCDAAYALTHALSFDFVIVMHMMKEIIGIIDKLCQTLQQKSIDIVNALSLVSATKILIQKLRDEGWQSLLDQVVSFCEKKAYMSLT
ncbi:uncharacterized protein LOC111917599 [Lactuca sativa]|uniref:uncharacterized protein LOC111917599 n=1 Tax=Lactuca sativa TaxID=4236 RepID=UPI000CD8D032|nr:uncharacterized protein LOC111917599 [Lactuca sativa]